VRPCSAGGANIPFRLEPLRRASPVATERLCSSKRRRAVAVGCSGPYAASSIVRARSSSGRAAAGSPRSGPARRCRRQQVRSAHAGRPICPVCTCPTLTDASVADLRAQLVERICISVGTHLGIAKHLEHLAAAGPLVPQVALVFAWLTLPQANGAAGRTASRLSSFAPPWPGRCESGSVDDHALGRMTIN